MMIRSTRPLLPTLLVLSVVGAGLVRPALAQSTSDRLMQSALPGGTQNPVKGRPEVAPPTAIPGSQAAPAVVIPGTRAASDMAPNEALFDAINRGDIVAARDAMTRGADMSSQNVLGMTPLELAIDLNRRDIEFLLLSLRGDDGTPLPPGGAGGPGGRVAQAGSAGPVRQTAAEIRAERRAEAVAARAARTAKQPVTASATAQAPQLFAGNGGTPIPQAGFLGFNGH